MKTYSFTVDLSRDFTDLEVDRLYEFFRGDVTSAVQSGRPYLGCDLRADSLEKAILDVVDFVNSCGIEPLRAEIEPEGIMSMQAA